jgi:hypothetical protein
MKKQQKKEYKAPQMKVTQLKQQISLMGLSGKDAPGIEMG